MGKRVLKLRRRKKEAVRGGKVWKGLTSSSKKTGLIDATLQNSLGLPYEKGKGWVVVLNAK